MSMHNSIIIIIIIIIYICISVVPPQACQASGR